MAIRIIDPEEEEEEFKPTPGPRIAFAPTTVLEPEPLAPAVPKITEPVSQPDSIIRIEGGGLTPVADEVERQKFEDVDPGILKSFFVGFSFNPITKFAVSKLSDPLIGESDEEKEARVRQKLDKIEATIKEKRPVARFAGSFTGEMLEFAIAGGIVGKVLGKTIAKIGSKSLQRLIRGGGTGALTGGGEEAIGQAFTDEKLDALAIAKESAKEAALFGIVDVGLGKVVDLIRAGRAARVTTGQAKTIEKQINKAVEAITKQREVPEIIGGQPIKKFPTSVVELASVNLDANVLAQQFFKKRVKGFKVETKSDMINTKEVLPTIRLDGPRMLGINLERLSGSADVLDKSKFKKKFTQLVYDNIDKLSQNRPMTTEEILQFSKVSGLGEMGEIFTQETLENISKLLATRAKAVNLIEREIVQDIAKVAPEKAEASARAVVEQLQVVQSIGTHFGRMLNAHKIKVGSIETAEVQKVISQAVKTVKKNNGSIDELIREWAKINKQDFREIAKFHRKFMKPTAGEILERYRYINLLSSPKTQIVNNVVNLGQVGLPIFEKATAASLDLLAANFKRRKREKFFGAIPFYITEGLNSIGPAKKELMKVLTGERLPTRLEFRQIPLFPGGGRKATLLKQIAVSPITLMEGGDVFFRTIIEGGERAALNYSRLRAGGIARGAARRQTKQTLRLIKEGKLPKDPTQLQIAEEARRIGEYRLFRQESFAEGQGDFLNGIDVLTDKMIQARDKFKVSFNTPFGKVEDIRPIGFFIPFIQTASNIFKQGIEFSPAGFATIRGSADQTAQLAKALMGTVAFTSAGVLAMNYKTTWQIPSDPKERELFLAGGFKPHSLQLPVPGLTEKFEDGVPVRGQRWIEYRQLGPLGYPIAMASALYYHYERNGGDDAAMKNLAKALPQLATSIGVFFSEMTYMQGLSDIMAAVQGEDDKVTRIFANTVRQNIPYVSMLGWIDRMADTVYRDPENFIQFINAGLPFLSEIVPPHPDEQTTVAIRQFPILNAFSPFGVTEEDPLRVLDFKIKKSKNIFDREKKEQDKIFKRQRLLELTPRQTRIGDLFKKIFGKTAITTPPELQPLLRTEDLKEEQ